MSENEQPEVAPPKQAEPKPPSPEMLALQIGDHQRAIGDLTVQLLNAVLLRDRYIESLSKPAAT
jgi:hypothetical protein